METPSLPSPVEDNKQLFAMMRGAVHRIIAQHWTDDKSASAPGAVWDALVSQGYAPQGSVETIGGISGAVLIAEELGRAGCPAPFLPAVAKAMAYGEKDSPNDLQTTVGFGEVSGDRGSGKADFDGTCLNGELHFVEFNPFVRQILVFANGGTVLCLVPVQSEGVITSVAQALNTEPWVSVRLEAVRTDAVAISGEAARHIHSVYRLCLAARAYGAARRSFDLAVEHARTREQFGQVIGRFQAIQHKLANCLISLDAVQLHIEAAAKAMDAGDRLASVQALYAIASAGNSLRQVALETQHTLGAVGYAEEHEAPNLFRRIHLDVTALGGVRQAHTRLAELLLDRNLPLVGSDEDEASRFRRELRDWLNENWTRDDREKNRQRPFDEQNWNPEFARRMGDAGLTMLTWSKEAGGQARAPLEQLAFLEETFFAGAPLQPIMVASWILGPEIVSHGSKELQAALLPGIRRGEHSFCLGYSEPNAGSDLASLKTRAVRDGDHYLVNGQKIWTTDGHRASHMILAARTDPDPAKKHGGISLFVIPMDMPGISVRPSMAFYGYHFCNVFLDDVRVPASFRLGPENGGWRILTSALASERVIMASFGTQIRHLLENLIIHIRQEGLTSDPFIRDRIASLACDTESARLLALRAILPRQDGSAPLIEAAIGKVYASELGERLAEAALDMLGPVALLSHNAKEAPLGGAIDQMLRRSIMMVVGGGTAEIQRSLIAQRKLDLPR